MRLEHIAINVNDALAMAQWYVEHLEMVLLRSQKVSPYAQFLADANRQSVIELYSNPAGGFPTYADMSVFTFHIAFEVMDMAGTRSRLIEVGAIADGEVVTTPSGDQLAFLRDPWGVTVQLAKRVKPML